MLLGVDVGGTFTDAVLVADGQITSVKTPTTPKDQSIGVQEAVAQALRSAGRSGDQVDAFAHGMTVATNALLEGTVARTALVATAGFTDLVALRRQARADLYRLCKEHPAPLVPSERRIAAAERMTPDGVLVELDKKAVSEVLARVGECAPTAVAVILLHSYRHPQHELALGEALRDSFPGMHVSLSHEVVGTFREYERAATTEIDAALSPLLSEYLDRLADRARNAGLPKPSIMQSNGGSTDLAHAASHAVLTVLSGPAGGAAGAALAAQAAGVPDVLGFDMGGTSCDVCAIHGGRVDETSGFEVAGRAIALPALDIQTVGAGGGSIAWSDAGGALRVGPRSAGADPGPACYGRGGHEPTVTDANLVLGRLAPGGTLAGGVALDRAAAYAAVEAIAASLGLDPTECAEGIVRVANAEMAGALRRVTVERGVDPREFALMPFGGAGPMHAAEIAQELGIRRIVCPRSSGVLSALGLAASHGRRDAQLSVLLTGDGFSDQAVGQAIEGLVARATANLGDARVALRASFELRYRGQAHELTVEMEADAGADALRAAFESAHQQRYGFRDDAGEVELVTIRVTATTVRPEVQMSAARNPAPQCGERLVRFEGRELPTTILRGDLPEATAIVGPAVCELPEATLVVSPGWSGAVTASGAIVLERGGV